MIFHFFKTAGPRARDIFGYSCFFCVDKTKEKLDGDLGMPWEFALTWGALGATRSLTRAASRQPHYAPLTAPGVILICSFTTTCSRLLLAPSPVWPPSALAPVPPSATSDRSPSAAAPAGPRTSLPGAGSRLFNLLIVFILLILVGFRWVWFNQEELMLSPAL
jgi:hypothetical protein